MAFTLRWVPPAAAAVGAAVCACISGGVTCVGYANGQVVALIDKWQSPIWVWDEGGRSVRMFTRGSGFARTLTSIDRVTCLCMFGGCVVWGLGDGGVCVGRLATGECVRWVQRVSRDASSMISRLFVFPHCIFQGHGAAVCSDQLVLQVIIRPPPPLCRSLCDSKAFKCSHLLLTRPSPPPSSLQWWLHMLR